MESNSSDVPDRSLVQQTGSTSQLPTPQEEIAQPPVPEKTTSNTDNNAAVINDNGDYPFTAPTPPFLGGRPGMLDASTRNSTATSMNFQGSEYGSVAPLRKDGVNTTSGPFGEMGAKGTPELPEKEVIYEAPRSKSRRKGLLWGLVALGVIILVIVIVVPVYFLVIKKKDGDNGSGGSGSNTGHTGSGDDGSSGQHTPAGVTWGGDGSTVTKEDGTTFIYNNSFGGYWVYDPQNPLNNSARCQDSSPPLSEKWKWGQDIIYGVNLGGWLNLEPFISPALYEPFFPNAIDEWSLSELIQARDGNLNAIEEHYKTFIVEEDFAMIAAAGLNWVRIPIPFWLIEVYPGEPFLARTGWTYFLKAIEWARKYGLRINLDLHAVPGSQNGWNHSGKHGQINFLAGTMGVANAQRTMDYIRIIAEFISQPEYSPVVPFFGILNEPNGLGDGGIPQTGMQEFYAEAYRVIRKASGLGDGNGPMIGLHEAFYGFSAWYGFLDGADRLALDSHPYLVFGSVSGDPVTAYPPQPCSNWGSMFGDPMNQFGMTVAGEWSYAINDCGLYVNQVGSGTRYEGTYNGNPRVGDCTADGWLDYRTWDETIKESLRGLGMSTMDALGNSFFWTWRIGESLETGRVMAPFWSYKLSVQEGWAPVDPRMSKGYCQSLGQTGNSYSGTLNTNSAGGPGAGGSVPSLESYAWPPTVVGGYGSAASLPTYTPTGPLVTLPVPQATQGVNFGDGWNNADDTDLMNVPISGCAYPDPWNAVTAAVPVC